MALHYPEVNDLDELFGFSAARQKAEEAARVEAFDEDPNFIPHRIFLNQVDSYNAKHISSFVADQIHGASKKSDEGEEGEGEEEIENEEAEKKKPKSEPGPVHKYEIIGTLHKSFHKKTEDILYTVDENSGEFMENIMKCGFVIYDITKDPNEIPKALATLTAMETEIEKLKELGPKTYKSIEELRVFILISTVMTWAVSKPIDPDEPEVPFTEADYRKRKTHPNYKEHMDCEKEVILKGRTDKNKLRTYVIASGMIYGAEEDQLTFIFKLAWNNENELPIFFPGKNFVPLIHVKDLAKVVHVVMENVPPKPQYILAVEQTAATLKQVVKALTKTMGSGKTKEVSAEEAFLYKEITQTVFERCTVNLNMEPGFIVESEIEWQNELNLAENMTNIVNEFKRTRGLKPLRVIIHGPPGVGKTRIAKQISEYYGAHYINVKLLIDQTLQNLRDNIEREKAKIEAKEQKTKAMEEAGEDVEEEEGEEAEEEEEVDIEELEEQLKEIETTMEESENGKLPNDVVNNFMKAFLLSNRCQNQGYVIDGYPKTIEQAKELFGSAEGEGEEEEMGEEEGGGGRGGGENKLLPDYVVGLQATDQFLCQRIMSLPEREIQGTHYMEEHMLRRLSEFRANNTEDNTPLNFFDEIEIHPIILDVMHDKSETMASIMETLIARFGKPIVFDLTPEEEEELIRLEEERQKLLAREAQMQKQLLEQQAVEEHQNKMEQWTELLEQLQMEEEKILVAQGEPLRHYLIKFVFPTLSKGLLEVARIKPDDPVDFLAEFLFKENPEGHMFDPAYTRDGKRILDKYKDVEQEIDSIDEECKCK